MRKLPDFVVSRHCVPRGPEGLSAKQHWLLDDPARVRIFSAPTGAGKSYAFQHAVVRRNSRVLFVVPTRRLAQNLARSITEDLRRTSGDPRRVLVWTSDERSRLIQENPDIHVGRLRFGQARGGALPEGGCIVIATPESVAWLLLRPSYRPHGAPPIDIADIMRFDHVVFDEFHTIDSRGMGLAAAVTRVAADVPESARVTFLSATPVNIASSLAAFDPAIQPTDESEDIENGPREATGDARAVHGDVHYRFVRCDSMVETLRSNEDAAKACIKDGRQLVVVFDSVADLNREKQDLADWFDQIGVDREQRLSINSADDSVTEGNDTLFDIGRNRDPLPYKALVATSSIEMGVTFRAGMMVIDPGHDATSLVQRAGRVARGEESGEVVIHVTHRAVEAKPWLKMLLHSGDLPADGSAIEVDTFSSAVLADNRRRLNATVPNGDEPPRFYGTMPQRAVWCASVFWAALEFAGHIKRGQRQTLRSFTPKKAGYVLAQLRLLKRSELGSAQNWLHRFLDEALRFRIILPRVTVRDASGEDPRKIPYNSYASHSALRDAPAVVGDDGDLEIELDVCLNQAFSHSERVSWRRDVDALFPHRTYVTPLDERRLKEDWMKVAKDELRRSPLLKAQRTALEAALELVRLSGIVPVDDGDTPAASGGHVVL